MSALCHFLSQRVDTTALDCPLVHLRSLLPLQNCLSFSMYISKVTSNKSKCFTLMYMYPFYSHYYQNLYMCTEQQRSVNHTCMHLDWPRAGVSSALAMNDGTFWNLCSAAFRVGAQGSSIATHLEWRTFCFWCWVETLIPCDFLGEFNFLRVCPNFAKLSFRGIKLKKYVKHVN